MLGRLLPRLVPLFAAVLLGMAWGCSSATPVPVINVQATIDAAVEATAAAAPSPISTPTPIPTATQTPMLTLTSTAMPIPRPTPTATPTPMLTPTSTAMPIPHPTSTATPTPTSTPTPYPVATLAPHGHLIGSWIVYDAEQIGTGDRLHGIAKEALLTGYSSSALLVIRCNEQRGPGLYKGLGLYVQYEEIFDPPEERIRVRSIINGEERTSEWELHPGHESVFSLTPEETALWLLENSNEKVYFTVEASGQPARYSDFDLTGIETALWQALPCDESKFTEVQ